MSERNGVDAAANSLALRVDLCVVLTPQHGAPRNNVMVAVGVFLKHWYMEPIFLSLRDCQLQ